jgi:hypothetical protein
VLWLARKFQPPEFCKVSQRSAVVGRGKSNLLHFTKEEIERSGWLNKNQPPIIASLSWSSVGGKTILYPEPALIIPETCAVAMATSLADVIHVM